MNKKLFIITAAVLGVFCVSSASQASHYHKPNKKDMQQKASLKIQRQSQKLASLAEQKLQPVPEVNGKVNPFADLETSGSQEIQQFNQQQNLVANNVDRAMKDLRDPIASERETLEKLEFGIRFKKEAKNRKLNEYTEPVRSVLQLSVPKAEVKAKQLEKKIDMYDQENDPKRLLKRKAKKKYGISNAQIVEGGQLDDFTQDLLTTLYGESAKKKLLIKK